MRDPARMHFLALPQAEQEAAIRRLAASGYGAQTIAHVTNLSVEQIRRVLDEPTGDVDV